MAKKQLIARALEIYKQRTKGKKLTKAQISAAYTAISLALLEHMAAEKKTTLDCNVGHFITLRRNERKGRNPATGEEITISARMVVKFHEGKALRDVLNAFG